METLYDSPKNEYEGFLGKKKFLFKFSNDKNEIIIKNLGGNETMRFEKYEMNPDSEYTESAARVEFKFRESFAGISSEKQRNFSYWIKSVEFEIERKDLPIEAKINEIIVAMYKENEKVTNERKKEIEKIFYSHLIKRKDGY